MGWWEQVKALVLSLWPFVNAQAKADAKRAGEEAAAQVRTLEDAERAAKERNP